MGDDKMISFLSFPDAHLGDVCEELLVSVGVGDEDHLDDGDEEEAPGGAEPVDEGEHEDAPIGAEGQPQDEEDHAHSEDHGGLPLPQRRPFIHHRRDQRLHPRELRIQAQRDQHREEEKRPQRGHRQFCHCLGVGDERCKIS